MYTKVEEVKSALERLLDVEYHEQLSLNAREVAVNRFTKTKVVNQYLHAYDKLLQESRSKK